jgi:MFS family permease
MLVTNLVRGVAVGLLAALGYAGALANWHLYAAGVVVGAAEAFFWPASSSIVPSLVDERDLPRANALVGISEQTARLAGPILGGALVALTGLEAAVAFNALTFFFSAATVFAAPRGLPSPGQRLSAATVLRDIRFGLSYAGRSFEMRVVLALIAASTLSYSGLFAVGLPALSRTFDNGAVVLGVVVSAWGLGQLIGTVSATVTGLPRRWGLLIIGMTILEGASFAVLGLVPHYVLAAVLLALLGIGVAYSSDVALPTFVQTRTAPEVLGRVNSVIDLPRVVFTPLSVAGMGLLASVDVRWTFAVAAVPMLLVGVGLATSPRARHLSAGLPSSPRTLAPDAAPAVQSAGSGSVVGEGRS